MKDISFALGLSLIIFTIFLCIEHACSHIPENEKVNSPSIIEQIITK